MTGVLLAGLLVEVIHELAAGSNAPTFPPIDDWLHDGLIFAAALVCARGAVRRPRGFERAAWWCLGGGLFVFAVAESLWGWLYPDGSTVPVPNVTDVLYLGTYPLFMAGLVLLVRGRVPNGQWHRWLDGFVIILAVATVGVVLVLLPVLATAPVDPLGQIVTVSYPVGDLLLLGALLGALPLLSWRLDPSWRWVSLGLILLTVADSIYAVAATGTVSHQGPYDFLWSAGSLALAVGSTRADHSASAPREVTGWVAIALPLAAQLFAVATQIYGYVREVPPVERLLTVAVLAIGIAQIIAARPRPRPNSGDAHE